MIKCDNVLAFIGVPVVLQIALAQGLYNVIRSVKTTEQSLMWHNLCAEVSPFWLSLWTMQFGVLAAMATQLAGTLLLVRTLFAGGRDIFWTFLTGGCLVGPTCSPSFHHSALLQERSLSGLRESTDPSPERQFENGGRATQ